MTQSWHDVLFAHWPVAIDALRAKLPADLELDLFGGEAWLGIVPFRMTNVAPRGVPALPGVSAFPELNVRTYVIHGERPGVYFFSLDAASSLAVMTARTWFHLPYYTATMIVAADGDWVAYASRRDAAPHAAFTARYRPAGPAQQATPGSFDYFLTERYCLYTADEAGRLRRLEIHHRPWLLQAADASIEVNTMAEAAGIRLPSTSPVLHFAKRQDTLAWLMDRV